MRISETPHHLLRKECLLSTTKQRSNKQRAESLPASTSTLIDRIMSSMKQYIVPLVTDSLTDLTTYYDYINQEVAPIWQRVNYSVITLNQTKDRSNHSTRSSLRVIQTFSKTT
uniref:Uncharacterized protein n=1 Tax=Rhizophora mucronata TaxID=61149 RepID=A0A2P2P1P3_RHIMU